MLTVQEMYALTPDGESRLFEAQHSSTCDNHCASARFDWEFHPALSWNPMVEILDNPRAATRRLSRIALSTVSEPLVTCDVPSSELVDFQPHSFGVHFMSDRLCELIEKMDPGSLERRKVTLLASDGPCEYNLVLPMRSEEAVDFSKTDFEVTTELINGQWIRRGHFPGEVFIREDAFRGGQNFCLLDLADWVWSRELFEAAFEAGIAGVRPAKIHNSGITVRF